MLHNITWLGFAQVRYDAQRIGVYAEVCSYDELSFRSPTLSTAPGLAAPDLPSRGAPCVHQMYI